MLAYPANSSGNRTNSYLVQTGGFEGAFRSSSVLGDGGGGVGLGGGFGGVGFGGLSGFPCTIASC